jgi:hypothetical protein
MLDDGVATKEDIDYRRAPRASRTPIGPAHACSTSSGLDTALYISSVLYDEFKDPLYAAPTLLKRMVAAGHLGWKFRARVLRLRERRAEARALAMPRRSTSTSTCPWKQWLQQSIAGRCSPRPRRTSGPRSPARSIEDVGGGIRGRDILGVVLDWDDERSPAAAGWATSGWPTSSRSSRRVHGFGSVDPHATSGRRR